MTDDIIASGETMLDSVATIKRLGARRVFVGVSYAFFTNEIDKFNKAYEKGQFEGIFISNASYVRDEVLNAPWYKKVSIIKYIAYYIYCVSSGILISEILDPHTKITKLMEKYKCQVLSPKVLPPPDGF